MVRQDEGSSLRHAEIAGLLRSAVFPACHNFGLENVRRTVAKVGTEIPVSRCTFDESVHWLWGLGRCHYMTVGL